VEVAAGFDFGCGVETVPVVLVPVAVIVVKST